MISISLWIMRNFRFDLFQFLLRYTWFNFRFSFS